MKCIGVITGPSAEAALYYAQTLHREARCHVGPRASACVLAHHLTEIATGPKNSDTDQANLNRVVAAARGLESCGAEQVLLGSPELQAFTDHVAAKVGIPVRHICRVTAETLRQFKLSSVGLLGTRNAFEERMWSRYLHEHGCTCLLPTREEREWVTSCLEHKTEIDPERAKFIRIVTKLRHAEAKAVVLCRPEIGRYLREEDTLLPLVCAAEQQVRAAVAIALGKSGAGKLRR